MLVWGGHSCPPLSFWTDPSVDWRFIPLRTNQIVILSEAKDLCI
jgi:hypothetical protein